MAQQLVETLVLACVGADQLYPQLYIWSVVFVLFLTGLLGIYRNWIQWRTEPRKWVEGTVLFALGLAAQEWLEVAVALLDRYDSLFHQVLIWLVFLFAATCVSLAIVTLTRHMVAAAPTAGAGTVNKSRSQTLDYVQYRMQQHRLGSMV